MIIRGRSAKTVTNIYKKQKGQEDVNLLETSEMTEKRFKDTDVLASVTMSFEGTFKVGVGQFAPNLKVFCSVSLPCLPEEIDTTADDCWQFATMRVEQALAQVAKEMK